MEADTPGILSAKRVSRVRPIDVDEELQIVKICRDTQREYADHRQLLPNMPPHLEWLDAWKDAQKKHGGAVLTTKVRHCNIKRLEEGRFFELPPQYLKAEKMTRLELDSLVEYDMDEEDVSWLKKHGHGTSEDNFELVMDLLEKEAFWMVQKKYGNDRCLPSSVRGGTTTPRDESRAETPSSQAGTSASVRKPSQGPRRSLTPMFEDSVKEMAKKEQGMIVKIVDPATSPEALLRPQKERPCVAVAEQPSADALQFDDVICDACRDGDSVDGNQIVLCDGCDVAIHQRCYGIGEVPEGDWFCERCIAKKAKDPSSSHRFLCSLCGQEKGAMLQSKEGAWVHAGCALLTSGVSVETQKGLQSLVVSILKVIDHLGERRCFECKEVAGAVVPCSEKDCKNEVHPRCALNAELPYTITWENSKPAFSCRCSAHGTGTAKTRHGTDDANDLGHGPKQERFPKTEDGKMLIGPKLLRVFVITGMLKEGDELEMTHNALGGTIKGSVMADAQIYCSHTHRVYPSLLSWCKACQSEFGTCGSVHFDVFANCVVHGTPLGVFREKVRTMGITKKLYQEAEALKKLSRRPSNPTSTSASDAATAKDSGGPSSKNTSSSKDSSRRQRSRRNSDTIETAPPVLSLMEDDGSKEEVEAISYDDIVCSVCYKGDSEDSNQIVFCDGCGVAVHQDCYGLEVIPEGDWFCQPCQERVLEPSCALCPLKGGAMKRTTDKRWAHISCALWIPEVRFQDEALMDGIIVRHVDKERYRLVCCVCRGRDGACIQCSRESCTTAFHVTCAQRKGFYLDFYEIEGTDGEDDDESLGSPLSARKRRERQRSRDKEGGDAGEMTFLSYCDKHRPKGVRFKLRGKPVDSLKGLSMHDLLNASKVSLERCIELCNDHDVPLKKSVIKAIHQFWTQKRTRVGMFLIRRLQILSKDILDLPRVDGCFRGGARVDPSVDGVDAVDEPSIAKLKTAAPISPAVRSELFGLVTETPTAQDTRKERRKEKLRVKAERKERTQFLKKFRGRKQRNMIKKLRIQLDKARTILALVVSREKRKKVCMKETFDCLEESVKLGREKLSEVFMSHEPTPLVPGEKWGEADDDWRWSTSEGSSVEFSETDSSSESSSDEESDDEKERERSATKRRHLDLQQELERTGRLEISVQDALASRFPRGDTKKVILRLRPRQTKSQQRSRGRLGARQRSARASSVGEDAAKNKSESIRNSKSTTVGDDTTSPNRRALRSEVKGSPDDAGAAEQPSNDGEPAEASAVPERTPTRLKRETPPPGSSSRRLRSNGRSTPEMSDDGFAARPDNVAKSESEGSDTDVSGETLPASARAKAKRGREGSSESTPRRRAGRLRSQSHGASEPDSSDVETKTPRVSPSVNKRSPQKTPKLTPAKRRRQAIQKTVAHLNGGENHWESDVDNVSLTDNLTSETRKTPVRFGRVGKRELENIGATTRMSPRTGRLLRSQDKEDATPASAPPSSAVGGLARRTLKQTELMRYFAK